MSNDFEKSKALYLQPPPVQASTQPFIKINPVSLTLTTQISEVKCQSMTLP